LTLPLWTPLLHAAEFVGAHLLVEAAVHPLRTDVAVQFEVDDVAKRWKVWYQRPIILPEPGALLDVLARYPDSRDVVLWALRKHGIGLEPGLGTPSAGARRYLWQCVAEAHRSVPGPDTWIQWAARGWEVPQAVAEYCAQAEVPLDDWQQFMLSRAGGHPGLWSAATRLALSRPTPERWLEAFARGLTDDEQRMLTRVREAGGSPEEWFASLGLYRQMPSVGEAIEGWRRGKVDDGLWHKILKFHLVDSPELEPLWKEFRRNLPGISDLLRMGSRQLFTPEIAGRYGLYDGFQEASRPYFKQLGLDYPLDFQIPVDGVLRQATLPDLYWGATREILPLGSAYLAYQRLRASNIPRYRDELPNLREFSLDDLRLHMRVQGYPPPMQDYLIALSHPPLGRRDINWGIQYGGKDRDWAYSQYLNLGLRPDDAAQVADTQYVRATAGETRWLVVLQNQARRTTVSEIEGMYDEGILDRGQALSQLAATGMPDNLSLQLLDLRDAKRSRALLRAAVTETGRDYLSGVLSAAEAIAALGRYGIKEQRRGELMQIWTVRRSRRRRQADTGKILKWIGEGRIGVDDARRRLSNLGWTDPDLMLLVGEGEGKLAELRARSEQAQAKAAAAQAKELERLSREAEAEQKRIRTEANRVAPRSTLTKWLQDGIITRDDFYALMRERGFPEEEIDRYYADATRPPQPKPRVVPAEAARARPAGSAHPAVAILQRWATEGIIDRAAFVEGLRALGYGDEDVNRFVKEQYEQSA
jgi:hypothetical protein